MSRVIKAAELKVLIPNESQTVIPAADLNQAQSQSVQGTVLQSTNLLKDAQEKAAEIVKQAEAKGAALLKEVEEQQDLIRLRAKEQGFEEGYQEGLQEGKKTALQEAEQLLALLESNIEETARVRAEALGALEDDFLKFSLLLADKIIRKRVRDDISWLTPVITDALQALGQVAEIKVRLNPVDYALIEEEQLLAVRAKLEFERDETIEQGGCLIESENGLIDARLEQRLGKLGRQLLEVLYNDGN